jgi:mannose-1-phosphate guanylyltransferase/mannose-6-phosphate isomerase
MDNLSLATPGWVAGSDMDGAPPGAPALALDVRPVILAGGAGTRLWPLSRSQYPKQLIPLVGARSMLENTAARLADGAEQSLGLAETIVICGEEHRFFCAEQMTASGSVSRIVLEPASRNTAPALTVAALAALDASQGGQDSVLVVMPADHAINDLAAFRAAVAIAAGHAREGAIAMLGIVPTRAETGYGYIKRGPASAGHGGFALEGFVEKPHLELAEQYLASGDYWWNSGIFVVRASVWLQAIEHFQPRIHAAAGAAYENATLDGEFQRLDRAWFETCPADSIDYAVMEKLTTDGTFSGVVVPLGAGWSDVGSWDAVWDISDKDEQGNVARGRVLFENTSSSFVHSEGRLVACVGVTDVVVVETADAVLVVNKNSVQDVKQVVNRLKAEHASEVENHRKVHRPWGHYDSVDGGDRFQVKRIVVNAGAKLSLQMHYHRAEHWIVVRGTALVTCGERTFLLGENESTHIPLGTVHRLENPGKTPLEIIEVQSGAYLGEDDIVRFDDNYGRA